MMPTFSDNTMLDHFPTGLAITTSDERKIICANKYFRTLFEQDTTTDIFIGSAFTAASRIMIESYVMPMLINQQQCNEIQLTIKNKAGERIPVIVNAQVLPSINGYISWAISAATRRDKLYQELQDLRKQMELKAERLQVLAQTDDLTGLANRRAFLKHGNLILKQASRMNAACAFLMIDIDDFKEVNDNYGHSVGDEVLRQMGLLFRSNCRENDTVARMGGEEFAIITICQTLKDAQKFAQKLINAVNAKPIYKLDITISVGLAVAKEASLEQLFKYADEQLYHAKNTGKNRVASTLIVE